MNLRVFTAMLCCRLLRMLARLLGRGGTAIPGRVALQLCPTLLSQLAAEVKTIVVTGTNGKSTCARMIEEALKQEGLPCVSNPSGANLPGGILADFAEKSSLSGKPRCSWAVIECDEAAAVSVFPQLQPQVILLTNLFPDQLDRFGDPAQLREKLVTAISQVPQARLCLNGNCPHSRLLAESLPNPCSFFRMEDEAAGRGSGQTAQKKPKAGYRVTAILQQEEAGSTVLMELQGEKKLVQIKLPARYNVENGLAAGTAICEAGFSRERAAQALEAFSGSFGRMEAFPLGAGAQMILIKNARGCEQVFSYLHRLREPYSLVLCQNDQPGDGRDLSWLWDVDFEGLCAPGGRLQRVYLSGQRAEELQLRLKYAELDETRIQVEKNLRCLVTMLEKEPCRVFLLPSYSAMLALRREVTARCGGRPFWEQEAAWN